MYCYDEGGKKVPAKLCKEINVLVTKIMKHFSADFIKVCRNDVLNDSEMERQSYDLHTIISNEETILPYFQVIT